MKAVCFILITKLIWIFIYNDESKILWTKDVKLKLEDFRNKVPKHNDKLAESLLSIEYSYQITEGRAPTFTVKTYFIKDSSWIKLKDENTLRHEKLHFDMAELYTRKMRRDIKQMRRKRIEDIGPYIEIMRQYRSENRKADELFDSQCFGLMVNGQVIERAHEHRQEEWIDSIKIELDRLKEYEYSE
ncbi:hypothetical protein [Empedobacter falsenii]